MAEEDKKEEQKAKPRKLVIKKAGVHPLVLLSVVDHFNRTNIKKRVVGVVLGKIRSDGVAECTNAYAVPFDEDKKTGDYFVDHLFVQEMFAMFKRVNASETILGWYHSGGELKANDITIHQSFQQYTSSPLLLCVNVSATSHELPVKAYLSEKTIAVHTTEEIETFMNLDVILVASPPEEVGVEHVLRDVQDMEHIPTLSMEMQQKKTGLGVLRERLTSIKGYLEDVREGKLPFNQDILYLLQDLFNIMPDINNPRLKASMIKVTNDQTLSVYVASIVRTVLSLDGLITNRKDNKRRLDESLKKKQKDKEKKDTSKAEKKEEESKPAEDKKAEGKK